MSAHNFNKLTRTAYFPYNYYSIYYTAYYSYNFTGIITGIINTDIINTGIIIRVTGNFV